jgi:hypothetical protein
MSHDWPVSVVNPKDFNRILKIKNFWADEVIFNLIFYSLQFTVYSLYFIFYILYFNPTKKIKKNFLKF